MHFPHDENQYEILNLIGSGSGSRVYEARCKTNNQKVAIKQINLLEYPLDLAGIQDQTAAWLKLSHPNITKFYGMFLVGNIVWMIIEYMEAGSLKDVLRFAYSRGIRDETLISTILSQVANGLKYLHDNKQMHHDVRSSKILIGADGVVKLTEIGLNISLVTRGNKRASTLSLFGEECYMAPEVLKNENDYNIKSDIWSFGLTAIELGTGKMPYAGMRFMESLVRIIDYDPPSLPDTGTFSVPYRDLVKICLSKEHSKRASTKEVLSSKFIKAAKGPEIIVRAITSALPPLSEIYKQLHPNPVKEFKLSQQVGIPNKPVHTVGRFKVTRHTTPNSSQQPNEQTPTTNTNSNTSTNSNPSLSEGSSGASINEKSFDEQENDSNGNSKQNEVEALAEELMELAAEMQQLQNENVCLKEKMAEITAVIENLQKRNEIKF